MLFTNLNESFERKDASLNQGSDFKSMQDKIITKALPKFTLIEKTSMSDINLMREPLANMKKEQKQQQKSLPQIDKEEFKKLNDIEAKFSKKLSEYVSIYNSRSDEIMKPKKCIPITLPSDIQVDWGGKSIINSCKDFTTSVGPYKLANEDGKWLETWCDIGYAGQSCDGTQNYLDNDEINRACRIGARLKSTDEEWKRKCSLNDGKKKCNDQLYPTEWGVDEQMCYLNNTVDTSSAKLKLLNEQLMSLSREMWDQTQKIQGKDLKLQKLITKKREKLNENIKKLTLHHTNFNKLKESTTTLNSQLKDDSLKSNSEYMLYMGWFIAATTIGAIAVQKLLK